MRYTDLGNSFDELVPPARRIAVRICRAYERRDDIRRQRMIRQEFDQFLGRVKEVRKILLRLERDLIKLNANVLSSLGIHRLSWLSNVIREAHIPPGTSLSLPIGRRQLNRTNFLKSMNATDPAEPLEELLRTHRSMVPYVHQEARFLRLKLQSIPSGRIIVRGIFTKGGAFQYSLMRLFQYHAKSRLTKARIEMRISQILNLMDKGGPSADSRGCDAVRKSVKRLSANHKLHCDRYLEFHLNSSISSIRRS